MGRLDPATSLRSAQDDGETTPATGIRSVSRDPVHVRVRLRLEFGLEP